MCTNLVLRPTRVVGQLIAEAVGEIDGVTAVTARSRLIGEIDGKIDGEGTTVGPPLACVGLILRDGGVIDGWRGGRPKLSG